MTLVAPVRAGRVPTRVRGVAGGLVVAAVVAGVWMLVVDLGLASPLLLPSLGSVLSAFFQLLGQMTTWDNVGRTVVEIAIAFAVAGVVGVAVGMLVGPHPYLRKAYEPVIGSATAMPLIVLYPVFVLLFGIGSTSKVAFGCLYGLFPVAVSTIAGLKSVSPSLREASRSMGAGTAQLYRVVYLPAALPQICAGLRTALILTTLATVAGEFIGGDAGLGYLLATSGQAFETVNVFAYVILTVCVVAALSGLLNLLLRSVTRAGGHPGGV